MSQIKGTVLDVVGSVTILGNYTRIKVGDIIAASDILEISNHSSIRIALNNGKILEFSDIQSVQYMSDYMNSQDSTVNNSINDIQAQILAGADPSKVTDASAAGGAPGAGGGYSSEGSHAPLIIDQVNNMGVVTSGYNTQPGTISFPDLPVGQMVLNLEDVLSVSRDIFDTVKPTIPHVDPSTPPVTPVDPSTPPVPPVEPPAHGGPRGNNGFGNGDQNAPGNSLNNNNAENAGGTNAINYPGNSNHTINDLIGNPHAMA